MIKNKCYSGILSFKVPKDTWNVTVRMTLLCLYTLDSSVLYLNTANRNIMTALEGMDVLIDENTLKQHVHSGEYITYIKVLANKNPHLRIFNIVS